MNPDEIFATMDQTAVVVSALTGMKTSFLEAGWSEPAAEQLVIEILRTARATTGST